MAKVLLILGATGKQGGAVVDNLLSSDFTILAVTRDPSSSSAQKLLEKSEKIKLTKGDLNDCPGIFKNAKEVTSEPIWGIFSVQVPWGKGNSIDSEERQGKALIDEAISQKIQHFVYTSVDRGGDKSSDNPTNVPHFISKHNIEKYLQEKTAIGEMGWTVLRPTCFYDNISPDVVGKGFCTMWKLSLKGKPMQFVACEDIGYFAAQAFLKPEQYNGKFISIAGENMTFGQAAKIFQEKTGKCIPTTFDLMGHVMLWGLKEMSIMMTWFHDEGYGVDIEELRQIHPELMDFGAWLEKKSKFETK